MTKQTANSEVSEDNSESRDELPVAHATPSRKTYDSVASDVSVESALGELVDNSLDSAALHGINPVEITIEIEEADDGTEELVYRDESGGVKQDEMGVFMGLGRSKNERAGDQNVGTFGMGAKRALKRLGDEFTIASHYKNADTGWQYTVPPEWFEIGPDEDDPNQWQFEMEPVDLGQKATEIRIRNLNFDWDGRKGKIEDWFGKTYQKFLQEESDVDLDLTLEFGNTEIESPEPTEWTYSPWFNGLHPREYTGLVFQDENWSGEVQARITVGLLREGDSHRAGTFIFCQNRLVEGRLINEKGGYGLDSGLPQFKLAQFKRLRIEIELFGDASDLPWSADKSRLRPSHKVLTPSPNKGIYWWLRRMADRHMQAGRYGAFENIATDAIFRPYDAESEHAANDGEIKEVNVSSKQERLRRGKIDHIRITDKPGNDYSPAEALGKIAMAHARLGVVIESMSDIQYAEWARPTYENAIGWEFKEAFYNVSGREFLGSTGKALLQVDDPEAFMSDVVDTKEWERIAQNLTSVSTVPPMSDPTVQSGNSLDSELSGLQAAADESVTDGERRTDGEVWRVPRYEAELTKALEETNDNLVFEELEEVKDPIVVEQSASIESEQNIDDETGTETATIEPSDVNKPEDTETPRDEDDTDHNAEIEDTSEKTEHSKLGQRTFPASESDEDSSDSAPASPEPERMTLAEFYQEHQDLLDDVPDEAVSDDEELEDHLVERLQLANAFTQVQSEVGQDD